MQVAYTDGAQKQRYEHRAVTPDVETDATSDILSDCSQGVKMPTLRCRRDNRAMASRAQPSGGSPDRQLSEYSQGPLACVGSGEAGTAGIHLQQHLRPAALDCCPPSSAGARGCVEPAALHPISALPSSPQICRRPESWR